ncbi:uncharacterized protein BDZ99DRAFT_462327 [Mytilinidion resinicola]|uniref:SUN domain-containing protein n=1 Tax=Mytilinidion resinicola TaxID=574789 RepID=A0A6A6YQK9_9PEZI|nr:uncharacterized protein BDZ99DRAFT_462327 [Mytilinidion resinicola]KAF2811051.1 hypothetical protein BDZ99DRAFT_462327 [Mytilinidion resinicola]
MPPIGAYVCIWTALLLLCSSTLAQGTNETASPEHSSISSTPTASGSTPSSSSSSSTILSSASLPIAAHPSILTCQFRTINYITHTLPQQCLKTSWSASTKAAAEAAASEPASSAGTEPAAANEAVETPKEAPSRSGITETASSNTASDSSASTVSEPAPQESEPSSTSSSPATAEPEAETDSPLDNANFLSFEEWKKQNLARAGQSPENVGQGRASGGNAVRRRPININNALDSLGEDTEIELDFGGFGNTGQNEDSDSRWASGTKNDPSKTSDNGEGVPPSSRARSKDAGKTCKERFNYASFDCAATVLKTNSQCKSSSSVLVENKDSYMLNECAAQNKFIIVELCDDILIDTIVLANFEFFSSMFRTFRISVSDRYPVKLDRWKELGTFEARNSRDIQAFLVENPLVWARYLRVEFLTHYGNEYYCPVSLLRVHGTTMMEEFRHQEEMARGEDDFAEPIEEAGEPVTVADPVADEIAARGTPEIPEAAKENESQHPQEPDKRAEVSQSEESSTQPLETVASESATTKSPTEHTETPAPSHNESISVKNESQSQPTPESSETSSVDTPTKATSTTSEIAKGSEQVTSNSSIVTPASTGPSLNASSVSSTSNSSSTAKSQGNETVHGSSDSNSSAKTASSSGDQASSHTQSRTASSQTQPPPSNPTTQESFFKSIHKRLQQLESNSTLSLQYIEEQSRILRDAFMKVEKRQLGKTENFLQNLNASVVAELKVYRMQYDQLWQSTILELESHREQYEREIGAISTRLTLLADELVFQKRMAVVQSTLLLLCLGLVLFVRSGTIGAQLDSPIVQQMMGSAHTHIGKRIFDTPPGSPEAGRRVRGFRNMWRGDTSGSTRGSGSGHQSDPGFDRRGGHLSSDGETDGGRSPVHFEFEPATPSSATLEGAAGERGGASDRGSSESPQLERAEDVDGTDLETKAVLATQSGPATPRGSRDSQPTWEDVGKAVGMLKASDASDRKRSPLRRSQSYDDDGEDKENYRNVGAQDDEDSGPGEGEDLLGF